MATSSGAARLDPDASDAGLDTFSVRLLAFEDAWSGRTGAKASAIRAEFGVAPARYYQLLSAILDSPTALRHDPLDRKSTRLNSSHVKISYAVFCLKKKYIHHIQ